MLVTIKTVTEIEIEVPVVGSDGITFTGRRKIPAGTVLYIDELTYLRALNGK